MATPDQIRRRGRWSLVVGTVVAALLFGAIAYADIIAPDADFVTLGNQGSRNLGTVSPGTTLTPQVSFELQCGGNQHVDNGLSVSLTFDAAGSTIPPGASMSASSAAIGPIPAAWPEDQNQCSNPAPAPIQDNGNSTVTITAPTTPGNYSFVPKWNVVEPESSDVTGADPIVTFTLVVAAPPDTTPPAISYLLTPDSPDGNNDWYRSNVSLVWMVTEAESPGSLVKTGCVDQSITTDQDATTYSCSASSTGGPAGPVSVTIKRDATAPSAVTTLDTTPNGSNDWYTTSPAWTTNGADSLSGLVNDPCQTATYAGPEGTGLTVQGTCTDKAGNATSDDSDPFKYDATGPSAALAVTAGTLGSNGWYTSDVTVDTDGADSISSPVTCTADQSQTTETTGQEFNGSCTNNAGLTTNAAPLTVKLDKTGPSAALAVTAGTPGGGGWYRSDVTVSTSGTDSISNPTTCTTDDFQTASTNGESFNGSCTNDAGLTTNATSLTVKLDKVPPTLTWSGGPANGGSYYFGSVPAAPTCTSVDPLYSGPTGCTVTGYTSAVGPHTMTATAFDLAGNSHSETRGYTVLAWTLTGFFQPVDMGATVWNTVKGGSTVPLKFEIFAGTTELTDTATVDSFSARAVTCPNGDVTTDEIEVTATGGTSLRYDATGGQFIYNWQTPKKPGSCYEVTMKTDDGSMLKANFKLK